MPTPPSASREYRGSSATPTCKGKRFNSEIISSMIESLIYGSSRRATRWRQDATELEKRAQDGRGNGAGAQGLWTRRTACLHRPRHIPRLVRRPWHKPGQRRTQKVRRGGGNREVWPTALTSTILARRCKSAWGLNADSHAKVLIQLTAVGSMLEAYSQAQRILFYDCRARTLDNVSPLFIFMLHE
jgi:hypothetical protein